MKNKLALATAVAAGIVCTAHAQQQVVVGSDAYVTTADTSKFHKVAGYSPYAGRRYPERPLFGDEHVHTSWSGDAGMGGTTLGPEQGFYVRRQQIAEIPLPIRLEPGAHRIELALGLAGVARAPLVADLDLI